MILTDHTGQEGLKVSILVPQRRVLAPVLDTHHRYMMSRLLGREFRWIPLLANLLYQTLHRHHRPLQVRPRLHQNPRHLIIPSQWTFPLQVEILLQNPKNQLLASSNHRQRLLLQSRHQQRLQRNHLHPRLHPHHLRPLRHRHSGLLQLRLHHLHRAVPTLEYRNPEQGYLLNKPTGM